MELYFWLLVAFTVKHLIVDFFLQTKYQWSNKHIIGHPGGLLHSGLHMVTTVIILKSMTDIGALLAIMLGYVEFVVHYFTDWAKMNISLKWKIEFSNPWFWYWLGVDQFIHTMTYIWLVWIIYLVPEA